jgi:hypothetical protein
VSAEGESKEAAPARSGPRKRTTKRSLVKQAADSGLKPVLAQLVAKLMIAEQDRWNHYEENLDNPALASQLSQIWWTMANELRIAAAQLAKLEAAE